MVDVKNLVLENRRVAAPDDPARDRIDEWLEIWLREIPALDARTEGVVDRIRLIERYIGRTHDETLEQFGLSWGEVRVLGSLRYGGAPYQSTPGRLASQLDLSSGAMTARLDKMEAAGLIRRLRDPSDRRGVLVELTDHGHDHPRGVGLAPGREGVDRRCDARARRSSTSSTASCAGS